MAAPPTRRDAARASGNTFIYLTDPISEPADVFQGDVWVHTVGAPETTRIGDNVFDCAVAGQRYIDSRPAPHQQGGRHLRHRAGQRSDGGETNFFTLTGGVVAGPGRAR